MEEEFEWSDSASKVVRIGGKINSTSDTISFQGTLAGASMSCQLAGEDHWNTPYFALASVSNPVFKGVWLFDENNSSI